MSTFGVVTILRLDAPGPGETSDVTATSSLPARVSDAMLTLISAGRPGAGRVIDYPLGREVDPGGWRVPEEAELALRRADQRARFLGGDGAGVVAEHLEGNRRARRLRRPVLDVTEELLEILGVQPAAPDAAASDRPITMAMPMSMYCCAAVRSMVDLPCEISRSYREAKAASVRASAVPDAAGREARRTRKTARLSRYPRRSRRGAPQIVGDSLKNRGSGGRPGSQGLPSP